MLWFLARLSPDAPEVLPGNPATSTCVLTERDYPLMSEDVCEPHHMTVVLRRDMALSSVLKPCAKVGQLSRNVVLRRIDKTSIHKETLLGVRVPLPL